MEAVKDFISENDLFAKHLGIELTEVGEGSAVARMRLGDEHLNSIRTAHGGAVFSLADLAFAAASNSHNRIAVGINVSISYVNAATEGWLTATAKEISRNHRLATYTVRVEDEAGDLVALFQGMVYRKDQGIVNA